MEWWRLTSYLADPAWGASEAREASLWGLATLVAVAYYVFSQVLVRGQGVHAISAVRTMFVAMLLCVGLTLATQQVGLFAFGYLAAATEEKSRDETAQGKPPAKVNPGAARGVVHRAAKVAPKNAKGAGAGIIVIALVILVLVVALLLIGGGYAFTAIPMPLWAHVLAFTVGVGCTEEISKLFAAIVLLSPSLGLFSHRRSLLPFVVAGLAFGVGESLFYFEDYAAARCDLPIYVIRASWCVLLHVAWTTIIGKGVLAAFGDVPELVSLRWKSAFKLLTLMLPVAALHGCYDALLAHDFPMPALVVGLVSLVWASTIWDGYREPVAEVAA